MFVRSVALVSALTLGAPAMLHAREQWGAYGNQQAYNEGYQRGLRAGEGDVRRGDSFNYTDESDFRRGDVGYRREYGSLDVYRNQFRRGFETGYREGYDRYNDRYGNERRNGPPPWANGRANGRAGRYGDPRYGDPRYGDPYGNVGYNYAFQNGYTDGYDRGLDDGRGRRRDDPFAESRYRSADHGYKNEYGSKETYKLNYREAFRQGYERGYTDGRRNTTSSNRPWWPF
jgi:flagellar biosynthesis/type III secretory pathway protein FliH